LNSQICACWNANHCFAFPCSFLTHRPSFATGEEWSQRDQRSTCVGTWSVSNGEAGLHWS
jgi:hypothetical protein